MPDDFAHHHQPPSNRWYDRDPALSRVMAQLETANTTYQAQIALNIIKIMVEHHIEEALDTTNDDYAQTSRLSPNDLDPSRGWEDTSEPYPLRRRWYDMNETLRSAITMLEECPPDLQASLLPRIVAMVEATLTGDPK